MSNVFLSEEKCPARDCMALLGVGSVDK